MESKSQTTEKPVEKVVFERIPEHVDDELDKEIMDTPDLRTPPKKKAASDGDKDVRRVESK